MEPQKTTNRQSNLKKKQNCMHHAFWFQSVFQSSSNQKNWDWHKNRHKGQRSKIEIPRYKSHTNGQLIYDKRAKIYSGENILSSLNDVGKISYIQMNKIGILYCI